MRVVVSICLLFSMVTSTLAQEVVILDDAFLSTTLARNIGVTQSPTDSIDWWQEHDWQYPLTENFKVKTGIYNWLKFEVKNVSDFDRTLLLFLQNVQIERAKLFVVSNGKIIYESIETGCTLPVSKRATNHRTISLPLVLPKNASSQVYAMVYRQGFGLTIRPTLVEPNKGINFFWTDHCFYAMIASSILLIISSLFFNYYVWTKKIRFPEIIWFQIYLIISVCYVLAASGVGGMYLWGNYSSFELNAAIFFGAVSGAAFLVFCNRALEIKREFPRLYKGIDYIASFYLLTALPGFFMSWPGFPLNLFILFITISYLLLILALMVVMGFGIYRAFVEKKGIYIWFLAIFIFLIVYTAITISLELGMMKYDFRQHALRILFTYFPQLIITLTFLILKFLDKLKELNKLLIEFRKEITHDIHDEIGSEITKISLASHVLSIKNPMLFEKLAFIRSKAVGANKKLKDLIFVINPSYDKLLDMSTYLREMVSVSDLADDQLQITPSAHLNEIEIQPSVKSHLIFIFDESIQIIKSSKSTVKVQLMEKGLDLILMAYTFEDMDQEKEEDIIKEFENIQKKYNKLHHSRLQVLKDEHLHLIIEISSLQ
ncbi:MAG TPA: 7TM-DISM domain-containing protein [Saprospiraceae bacterium]|nr:7TM-DISM domain-containing protein [Saprospiraceae bacterium]